MNRRRAVSPPCPGLGGDTARRRFIEQRVRSGFGLTRSGRESETTWRNRAIKLYRYRRARLSPRAAADGVRRARRGRPRLEDVEAAHERRVDAHDRARVVELAAVIGS